MDATNLKTLFLSDGAGGTKATNSLRIALAIAREGFYLHGIELCAFGITEFSGLSMILRPYPQFEGQCRPSSIKNLRKEILELLHHGYDPEPVWLAEGLLTPNNRFHNRTVGEKIENEMLNFPPS